jgi:hypothetical protein
MSIKFFEWDFYAAKRLHKFAENKIDCRNRNSDWIWGTHWETKVLKSLNFNLEHICQFGCDLWDALTSTKVPEFRIFLVKTSWPLPLSFKSYWFENISHSEPLFLPPLWLWTRISIVCSDWRKNLQNQRKSEHLFDKLLKYNEFRIWWTTNSFIYQSYL